MSSSSSRVRTVPTGFQGVLSKMTSVPVTHEFSKLPASDRESAVAQRRGDGRRTAAPKSDRRLVGVINRIGQQDGPVAVHQCPESRTHAERRTIGDQDLAVGIVREALLALELLGDRPAQGGLSLVVGIAGAAVAQGLPRRLDDVRRRRRIGLSAHQGDERATFGLKLPDFLQDLIDGRRPQAGDSFGERHIQPWPELTKRKERDHGLIATLPSSEGQVAPHRPDHGHRQAPGEHLVEEEPAVGCCGRRRDAECPDGREGRDVDQVAADQDR